jgi:hypothetical protein
LPRRLFACTNTQSFVASAEETLCAEGLSWNRDELALVAFDLRSQTET